MLRAFCSHSQVFLSQAAQSINPSGLHFPSKLRSFFPNSSFIGISHSSVRYIIMESSEGLLGTKRKSSLKIGTHNGSFHCDEALGCYLLRLTDKFKDADVIRSRDPKILDNLDVVIDVGGIYDPSRERYDHHQPQFKEVFGYGFNTKLSSAGLVYKHYGKEIVSKKMLPGECDDVIQRLYIAAYKRFMEAIDGIDNGINQFDTDAKPKYMNNTHLSARVGNLNPSWQIESTEETENEAFQKAMLLAGGEFMEFLQYLIDSWWPARSIVLNCIQNCRKNIHTSGEILVLNQYCPWKQHLHELEEELNIDPLPKYMLYEDGRSKGWRVQAISVAPELFANRKSLPARWRGLRDDELSQVTGIPGCVFVHASGFIGGNRTYEGALEMAKSALTFE